MSVLNKSNRSTVLIAILFCLSEQLIRHSNAQCMFIPQNSYSCKGVGNEEFLYEFYRNFREDDIYEINTMTIVGGNWMVIEYFPRIPNSRRFNTIDSLAINNASVEVVGKNAFKDFSNLKSLDLSRNQLETTPFVQYLPQSLKRLNLAGNKIKYVDTFIRMSLTYLDMSDNEISSLNFESIGGIQYLNFSKNRITSLTGFSNKPISLINLSGNKITEFNESKYARNLESLDLSFNNLRVVKLCCNKKFLNLSNSNISHFEVEKSVYWSGNYRKLNVKEVDLTNIEISLGGYIRGCFKLKNQMKEISHLEDFKQMVISGATVDLSYSTITSIPKHAFNNLDLNLLNLSYVNISKLNMSTFQNSHVDILDLSHSNIKTLQANSFLEVTSRLIDLSYNEISNVKNVFHRVKVNNIDLSFNIFKVITNNSYEGTEELETLILSNCLIEIIESQAFINLPYLTVLDLSNNALVILEKNTFHDLSLTKLKLEGNKIITIRSESFRNLPNLMNLNLSHVHLNNLELNAFTNLSSIEYIDLSHNDLEVIPPEVFVDTPRLQEVDFSYNNLSALNKFSNKLGIRKLILTFRGTFTSNKISNINIRHLALTHSTIDTLKADSFQGLFALEELHFNDSFIGFVESGSLNDLFSLRYLDSPNLFKHNQKIEVGTFKDLRSLRLLNLSMLSIKTVESMSFSGLDSVEVILLNNNNLVHLERDTFLGLTTLAILDVSYNHISEFDEYVFKPLENLQELHLEHNELLRIEPNSLKYLTTLRTLRLDHNNINHLAADSFSTLQNLRELHLNVNNLQKWPLGVFQYLPNLAFLNLSGNKLEAFENGAFSNLVGLTVLDLTNTSLNELNEVGVFFSMRKLEQLFLDGNRLKHFDFGRLMTNSKHLRYVGISHNKWQCTDLSMMIETFNNRSVSYKPKTPVYDSHNIDGISCIDVCDYVYCQHEYVQSNLS
nr:chaoptin-like [Leptinotarsa decemlineata]